MKYIYGVMHTQIMIYLRLIIHYRLSWLVLCCCVVCLGVLCCYLMRLLSSLLSWKTHICPRKSNLCSKIEFVLLLLFAQKFPPVQFLSQQKASQWTEKSCRLPVDEQWPCRRNSVYCGYDMHQNKCNIQYII